MLQSTPTGLDLSRMSLPAAFAIALSISPASRDEIEAGMGWSPDTAARIFNPSDNYWPSLPTLPRLCRVLGNSVMADWIALRAGLRPHEEHTAPLDVPAMLQGMEALMREFADITREAGAALGDGNLDAAEARRILREFCSLLAAASPLIAGLQAVREHSGRRP